MSDPNTDRIKTINERILEILSDPVLSKYSRRVIARLIADVEVMAKHQAELEARVHDIEQSLKDPDAQERR